MVSLSKPSLSTIRKILGTTDEASKEAQKNATELLGLPPDNTALDRARALGFDVDNTYYHGTANVVDKPQINEGIFQVQDLGKERVIKEFDDKFLGSSTGSDNKAHWFTDDPKTADSFAEYNAYMNAFAKLDAQFNKLKDKGISKLTDKDKYDDWYEKLEDFEQFELYSIQQKKKMLLDSSGSRGEHILPVYLRNNNQIVNDAKGSGWLGYFSEKDRTKGVKKGTELLEQAKKEGKDSVLIKNLNDTASKYYQQPSNQVAVLNPASIRSKYAVFDPKKLGVGAGSVMSADLLANEINKAQANDKGISKYGLVSEIPDAEIRPIERNWLQKFIGYYGDEILNTQPFKLLLGEVGNGLLDWSYDMPMSKEAKQDISLTLMPFGITNLAKVAKHLTRGITPFNYQSAIKGLPNEVKVNGAVEEFGTDPRLVKLAEDYSKRNNIPYREMTEYADADVNRAKRIADAYDKMKHTPNSPATKKAYEALMKETKEQYNALKKAGYKFDFMPDGADMYGNPRNAINDVVRKKHLYVFPTKSGFGSSDDLIKDSPLLKSTGEKWNGKDVTYNDMFRAVHDVFGHSKHGVGFRALGEENAFRSHASMYSDDALPALASETRGQNSWVNYGKHGAKNRTANTTDTVYADQKTGLLPKWAYDKIFSL